MSKSRKKHPAREAEAGRHGGKRDLGQLNALAALEEDFASWGMPVEATRFTRTKTKAMRSAFSEVRRGFLRHIAETYPEALRMAGLKPGDIQAMAEEGRAPNNYNVHHKLPISGGGHNNWGNLILIRIDPYHTDIHKHADRQLVGLEMGETRTIQMAMPEGPVFVPGHPELWAGKSMARRLDAAQKAAGQALVADPSDEALVAQPPEAEAQAEDEAPRAGRGRPADQGRGKARGARDRGGRRRQWNAVESGPDGDDAAAPFTWTLEQEDAAWSGGRAAGALGQGGGTWTTGLAPANDRGDLGPAPAPRPAPRPAAPRAAAMGTDRDGEGDYGWSLGGASSADGAPAAAAAAAGDPASTEPEATESPGRRPRDTARPGLPAKALPHKHQDVWAGFDPLRISPPGLR